MKLLPRSLKQTLLLTATGLAAAPAAYAQTDAAVDQRSLDFSRLLVSPSVSFYIPYAKEEETKLPANLNLEARYYLGRVLDAQATAHIGSFKGITVGGTLHLRDALKTRKTKFTVASVSSGRTTTNYFYRGNAEVRSVFGPTASLKIGSYSATGFFSRLDAGLDFQRHGRAYYRGYPSIHNGISSLKLLATFVKFNQYEVAEYKSRVGIGGLVSLTAYRAPWKRVSFYAALDGGYVVIPGTNDVPYLGGVTLEVNKSQPILEIRIGAAIGALRKKVPARTPTEE